MDYAEATLILVAEQLGILEIATLDRRGFSAYRTRRAKPFVLVLDELSPNGRRPQLERVGTVSCGG